MIRKVLISGIALMLASTVSFTAFAGEIKVTDMSDAVEYQYEETVGEEIEQTADFVEMSGGFQFKADESYVLGDVRGSLYNKTFTGVSDKYRVIVLGGIGTCYNTINAIKSLNAISSYEGADNIEVYLIDVKSNTQSYINDYISEMGLNGQFSVSSTSLDSGAYSLYSKCYASLIGYGSSYTLPLIVYVDPDGNVFNYTTGSAYTGTSSIISALNEKGLNIKKKLITVEYHTQSEIRNYVKNSGAKLNDALGFAQNPVTTSPYGAGRLSDAAMNSAFEMVKQIRYIAGLSDDIVLDEEMTNKAQAGMLVNYVNGALSHYPAQPADMDKELYELGLSGTSASNIAWASWQNRAINETMVFGWMNDGDNSNIDRLGHRRWILNPSMKKTGFGAVSGSRGTYSAIYALDRSNASANQQGIMWPAQNMPVEYFGVGFPWSFSSGDNENINNVTVVLTRLNDNKIWNFSASGSNGYFNVNNDGYGIPGCVIFRPNDIKSYNESDSFRVDIKGLKAGDVSYTVKFFSLDGIDTELTEEFVKRLYNVCLNREADEVGLTNWTNALVGKVLTGTETAYGFVFSPEFKNKNYCNTDFTKQLYRAFMGREADEGGLEFWVSKMKKGAKREEIFNAFSQSDEFRQICAQYGIVCGESVEVPVYGTVPTGPCSVDGTEDGVTLFVKRLYDVCLDRVVDEGGLDYWANALWNHNVNGISAAANFVFSEEFMGRNYDDTEYLNHLYKALMGRESDEGGIAYWSMRMKNGLSREDVFDSFAYSDEFTEICNSYGINI